MPSPVLARGPRGKHTSQVILDRATLRHLESIYYRIKTAASDIIGTKRKPDVLRVCRTQGLLEYSSNGLRHEIQPAGHAYFTSDADRRYAAPPALPYAKVPDDWQDDSGTEVYITGRSALQLKRDYFDGRMMLIIHPPSRVVLNGLRMGVLADALDDPDRLPEQAAPAGYVAEDGLPATDPRWLQHLTRLAERDEDTRPLNTYTYLTAPRTMVFVNELALRAGVDLAGDFGAARDHLLAFCSWQMRELVDGHRAFPDEDAIRTYLHRASEHTLDRVLGFTPELALV